MSLHESIIKIRVDLQNSDIKKSGKNPHARYGYFELKDFLPKLNELMLEHKVNDIISFEDGYAQLTLVKGEEKQEYKMPFTQFDTPLTKKGSKSMQDIQYLGALTTYYKRYLYMNAFGITDGEVIDQMDNSDLQPQQQTPRSEEEMYQEGLKKGLASVMGSLNKKENVEFRPLVIEAMCHKYGVDKWNDIDFGAGNYNKFIDEVKKELAKQKQEKEVGF